MNFAANGQLRNNWHDAKECNEINVGRLKNELHFEQRLSTLNDSWSR